MGVRQETGMLSVENSRLIPVSRTKIGEIFGFGVRPRWMYMEELYREKGMTLRRYPGDFY